MGLYQSTAASDVTLRSIPDESADTTNSANKEIDFDAALNKIAAETYSKIYNDISNIQKNSLEDSKAKVTSSKTILVRALLLVYIIFIGC